MSSTHGLKDFSSIWTFALTFAIVLSEQRQGSRFSVLATLRRPNARRFALSDVTLELLNELGVDVLLDENCIGSKTPLWKPDSAMSMRPVSGSGMSCNRCRMSPKRHGWLG